MSVFLSPVGGAGAQFFDNNGNPLTGGKLYTYAAGTTTPQATYTSAAGSTFHTNPIVLDAAGRVPGSSEIWLADNQIYKFVLKDSNDVLLATWDNITGVNSNFVNYTTETEVQTATAGQTVFTLTTMSYAPGTGSLTVYVDGVNQYEGDSYFETNSTTVTFTAGLHVGAQVKFTTAVQTTGNATDASVVSYTPPFTGSAATTVEAKLAQYISITDFSGADPTGVSDSTAAVQAAFNAVPVGGLLLVNGLFKITSTITISKPVRVIGFTFGYGSERTGFINETDTTLKMFAVRAHYVSFDNVLVTGAGKTGTSIGIEVGDGTTNYDKFAFTNDGVIFNFRYGIVIYTQNASVRSGGTVSTCGTGVLLHGLPNANDRRNIYFNEANFHSCDVGLATAGGRAFYAVGINGCDFNSNGVGVSAELSASTITGNNFLYSSGNDLSVTVGAGGAGNTISGNTFAGNQGSGTGYGINVIGNLCAISGNAVANKGGHGIAVTGSTNTIVGNTVVDSDYYDSGNYDNIYISGNANEVVSNLARTTTGGASRSRYGVNIASGFANTVSLNRVDGNKTAQINNSGASTLLKNNNGYKTENRGVEVMGAANTTVTIAHGLAVTPPNGSIMLTMAGASSSTTKIWLTSITSTDFTVTANTAPGGTGQQIFWSVDAGGVGP